METRRFKYELPPHGDDRKGRKSPYFQGQADNEAGSICPDTLSDSLDSPESNRLKAVNPRTAKTGSGLNEGSGMGEVEPEYIADIEDILNRGRTSPRVSGNFDMISSADSERIPGDSRLSRIRRNIAGGYYNSPEFIEKLADTLIEKLYLKEGGK